LVEDGRRLANDFLSRVFAFSHSSAPAAICMRPIGR